MKTTPTFEERAARRLKIIGGTIILLSFATQNFFYDRWDSRRSALRTAIDERAIIDKGALLNEVLYFTVNMPQEHSDEAAKGGRSKINEAARKTAMSSMMPVAYSESLTSQEKTRLINRLFTEAAAVGDYKSFLRFIQLVNSEYGKYSTQIAEQDQHLGKIRQRAQWVYLALYLLGSVTLLRALKYE
jgi:hypothetical protein